MSDVPSTATYSVDDLRLQQEKPWIELIEGDCLEVMPTLPQSYDCGIADPPYGDTSLEWDKAARGWVRRVAECLRPAASLWVFGSMRYLASLWPEIEASGFRYSQDIVWEKQNGTGFHADRFRRVHEHAVMFYRGKWRDVYHDPQVTLDARKTVARRKKRPTHTGHIDKGHYQSVDGGPRLVRSVVQMPNEHGRAVHPTQKPADLVALLIRYSCPPGGCVLAPFGGSGTTPLAARNVGRSCTAIEKDPTFYDIACNRLWPEEAGK